MKIVFQTKIRRSVLKIPSKNEIESVADPFILYGQLVVSMAQTDFSFLPQGAYRSIYDFRNLHPSYFSNKLI
jgi:hypothetical protein